MSSKETHFYTDTCDICGAEEKREWSDKGKIKPYYYGLVNQQPKDGYPTTPTVENSVDACELCRDKINAAIKATIRTNKP
jgi:hypothetical protein